jgi:hypothetical protein
MPHHIRTSSSPPDQSLKRLFTFQEFSIANYASQAQLYAGDREHAFLVTIMEIATRQTALATEIGNLLSTRRVFLQREGFPMSLTGLNYLGAAYVARRILVKQPELIAALSKCVSELSGDPEGQVLGRKALASEEENLRQLNRVFGETTDPADRSIAIRPRSSIIAKSPHELQWASSI